MTYRRGEKHPGAKLTARDVRVIRHLRRQYHWSYRKLGSEFGISHTQARRICLHESWKGKP